MFGITEHGATVCVLVSHITIDIMVEVTHDGKMSDVIEIVKRKLGVFRSSLTDVHSDVVELPHFIGWEPLRTPNGLYDPTQRQTHTQVILHVRSLLAYYIIRKTLKELNKRGDRVVKMSNSVFKPITQWLNTRGLTTSRWVRLARV